MEPAPDHPLRPFWQGYTFVSPELEQRFQAKFWKWGRLTTNLWCACHFLMGLAALISGLANHQSFALIHLCPLVVSTAMLIALNCDRLAAITQARLQETVVALCALATMYFLLFLQLEKAAMVQSARDDLLAPIYMAIQNGTCPNLSSNLDAFVESGATKQIIDKQLLYNALQFWVLIVFGYSYLVVLGMLLVAFLSTASFFLSPVQSVVIVEAVVPLAIAVFFCLLFSMAMANLRRKQFESEHRYEAELESALTVAQSADTILNHTLKNTMADAAAEIEVFLSQTQNRDPHLVSSMECLRRGMRSCRYRQAYLMLSDRKYKPVYAAVKLDEFGAELCAGRPMTVDCIPNLVLLDEVLVGLILDNAINNAFKHGSPSNPQVTFSIRDTTALQGGDQHFRQQGQGGAFHVTFTVTNCAKPGCPIAADAISLHRHSEEDGIPVLSNRVGLQHSALAAEAHGMNLSLHQTSDLVTFEASLWVSLAPADRQGATTFSDISLGALDSYTRGLTVYCIDDSASARRLLSYNLMKHLSCATVRSFGEFASDVPKFLSLALQNADIAILDEYLDFRGSEMVLGSDLVRSLRTTGFQGLVCIRSANVASNECDRYYASGADVVFGKDLPMTQLIAQLRVAFVRKKRHPCADRHSTHRPSLPPSTSRGTLWASRSSECMTHDRRSAYAAAPTHCPELSLPSLPLKAEDSGGGGEEPPVDMPVDMEMTLTTRPRTAPSTPAPLWRTAEPDYDSSSSLL